MQDGDQITFNLLKPTNSCGISGNSSNSESSATYSRHQGGYEGLITNTIVKVMKFSGCIQANTLLL